MRRLAASALILAATALGGCNRARDAAARFASAGSIGDTTLRFGQIDTSILTNGNGWVRKEPGVQPELPPPQQLQAPQGADSAFSPADSSPGSSASAPEPPADSTVQLRRGRRDTVSDTAAPNPFSPRRRQRRDTLAPGRGSARPDTTVPDTTG